MTGRYYGTDRTENFYPPQSGRVTIQEKHISAIREYVNSKESDDQLFYIDDTPKQNFVRLYEFADRFNQEIVDDGKYITFTNDKELPPISIGHHPGGGLTVEEVVLPETLVQTFNETLTSALDNIVLRGNQAQLV